MIYDCFTFDDEIRLLEIRLNELEDTVNHFVLVESTVTFNNLPKPLYYDLNKRSFERWNNKIIHVVVNDSPISINPRTIQSFQFNAIKRGLSTIQNTPGDYIFLSNIEEIPKKESMLECAGTDFSGIALFSMRQSYYQLNLIQIGEDEQPGTKVVRHSTFDNTSDIFQNIREEEITDLTFLDAGWKFELLDESEGIRDRLLKAFKVDKSSTSGSNSKNGPKINELEIISEETLPKYVLENREKFADWII